LVDDTTYASYSPDGLDLDAINLMLAEVSEELQEATSAQPTSALLDGSAAERRRRRIENRAMAGVVRAMPVRRAVVADGQAA
jgi:hypothetical protein